MAGMQVAPLGYMDMPVDIDTTGMYLAQQGKITLWIAGRITYKGVFGTTHETNFSYRYAIPDSGSPGHFELDGPEESNCYT